MRSRNYFCRYSKKPLRNLQVASCIKLETRESLLVLALITENDAHTRAQRPAYYLITVEQIYTLEYSERVYTLSLPYATRRRFQSLLKYLC